MLLTYNEVYYQYKNDYRIKKAIEEKKIYKLGRGVYSTRKKVNPLILYSRQYPNAIITLCSACFYYKLLNTKPEKVYLSIPRHSDKINDSNVILNYIDEKNINIGKINLDIKGEKINIYDKERLLIEVIRKKQKLDKTQYQEIITNYKKISNELDMLKLGRYMSIYKNEIKLSNLLLKEVFNSKKA